MPSDNFPSDQAFTDAQKLRLLVCIASFGEKNIDFLKGIIANYFRMPFEVTIIVLSNAPKDLGPRVKVVVGLPSKNPWSLPFAHKPLFAANVEAHDLFIYSEDDIGVSHRSILAFLRISPQLTPDEIPGFLRYEVDATGTWSLPEVHRAYHWKPESVRIRGSYTIAEFTCEHSAFYLITQAQLRRAIESGGFLREPYEGRYDMLCAAATDPYTSCGFRKVICISDFRDFLIHHLPNRYVGQFGVSLSLFDEQIQTLQRIARGEHPAISLGINETKVKNIQWSKSYDEKPSPDVLEVLPRNPVAVLSFGSGFGALELTLKQRGANLTVVPLDSVAGAATEFLQMEVVYSTMSNWFDKLRGRSFDCIIVTNLIHLISDVGDFMTRLVTFLSEGGMLVISGTNFSYYPISIRRIFSMQDYSKLSHFSHGGVNIITPHRLTRILSRSKMKEINLRWTRLPQNILSSAFLRPFRRYLAGSWILTAVR